MYPKTLYFKNMNLLAANFSLNFVPPHKAITSVDIKIFQDFLKDYNEICVLTGAGISTESGIPDYRSAVVGLYAKSNFKPVQYQEFVRSAYIRKRYWARNFLGWSRFSQTVPNKTHMALAKMKNKLTGIITQNVDRLHQKAGSEAVIELHGSAYRVVCLQCCDVIPREKVQQVLIKLNPEVKSSIGMIRPDGDVEINEEAVEHFQPPVCTKCGGILKPDIVFFGDNVPGARVRKVDQLLDRSDSLLVIGTSLSTYSSYRIVQQAKKTGKHIFVVNIGPTRGDDLINIKLEVKCSDLFI